MKIRLKPRRLKHKPLLKQKRLLRLLQPNQHALWWLCAVTTAPVRRRKRLLRLVLVLVIAGTVGVAAMQRVEIAVVAMAVIAAVTWGAVVVNLAVKSVVRVWQILLSVLSVTRWSMLRKLCVSWRPKPMARP